MTRESLAIHVTHYRHMIHSSMRGSEFFTLTPASFYRMRLRATIAHYRDRQARQEGGEA